MYHDRNLKTQSGFMLKMTQLLQKYSLEAEPTQLLWPLCSLDYIIVNWKTDPHQKVKKQDSDQAVMKSAMLKTVHMLHPEQDWLHIYTATFLTDKKGNVGAGIRCKLVNENTNLMQQS